MKENHGNPHAIGIANCPQTPGITLPQPLSADYERRKKVVQNTP